MSEAWINFVIVFLVQLVLFVVHAWYEKKLPHVSRILLWGALTGLVLGPVLDLVFCKLVNLCTYTLGFGTFFLILNGVLLYGLFAANTLLMQQAKFLHYFVWTLAVAAVFEVVNLFIPVWTYTFPVPSLEFFAIVSLGNLGAAFLITLIWHLLLRHGRFI
jgi:hypothetical protein